MLWVGSKRTCWIISLRLLTATPRKKLNEIKDQANSANPTKTYTNGILTNIDCKVLKNNFYSVCYSSELKNPIYGVSVLFGDLVDKNNIEKRLKRTHD
ncbi:hypothetical protein JP0100_06420 [Helicobacter pylori]|nr:hypothetical protein JP0100_06420 [Helicobacter pylori]